MDYKWVLEIVIKNPSFLDRLINDIDSIKQNKEPISLGYGRYACNNII